ncbi:hypothetical protein HZS_5947 [Henneguya salminicola]|nr:hypothetical protein HZS_5947 [Henneguya salminicola]
MFSTGVKLIGIDDFITPSKECIKPFMPTNNDSSLLKNSVSATLADCLSCSGCITSAEAVFVEQQGLEELDQLLSVNSKECQPKTVVFSISPQSFTSIMHKNKQNEKDCINRISSCLRTTLGVDYIFNTSWANEISIKESCFEFIQDFNCKSEKKSPFLLISGICPGWVCYAEKVQGDLIVPHLSKVRSSQGIMGSFIKSHFCKMINKSPDQIFHVSIMPCFDRKLEAYRPDLVVNHSGKVLREVDHVLSTYEFEELLVRQKSIMNTLLGFNHPYTLNLMQFSMPISLVWRKFRRRLLLDGSL